MSENEFRTRKPRAVSETVTVRGHMTERDGNRFRVRQHKEHIRKVKYGGNFKALSNRIAREYEAKGYSKEEAHRIGNETAADVYRQKLAKSRRR